VFFAEVFAWFALKKSRLGVQIVQLKCHRRNNTCHHRELSREIIEVFRFFAFFAEVFAWFALKKSRPGVQTGKLSHEKDGINVKLHKRSCEIIGIFRAFPGFKRLKPR